MNYDKLFKDIESGDLALTNSITLMMDNDGGYWSVDTGNELLDEEITNNLEHYYGRPNGYCDVVDVLNAAGVNTEWV